MGRQHGRAGGATGTRGGAASRKDMSSQFHAYFAGVFGAARWKQLSKALAADTQHVALLNSLAATTAQELQEDQQLEQSFSSGIIQCFRQANPSGSYPPPPADPVTGLLTHYWLDLASLLPPLLLAPEPGHKVLDMCAAPGGKTLILAQQLFSDRHHMPSANTAVSPSACTGINGHLSSMEAVQQAAGVSACQSASATSSTDAAAAAAAASTPAAAGMDAAGADADSVAGSVGSTTQGTEGLHPANQQCETAHAYRRLRSHLTANEVDQNRCRRLESVLKAYLPLPLLSPVDGHADMRVTCHAADQYWQRNEPEQYDRVLLDVPCSNDRHVLQQAAAQRGVITPLQWSEAGCRKLAALQLQLLLAGLRALAPGGLLVYSTCSLAPIENDAVVAQALGRLPGGAVAVQLPLQDGDGAVSAEQLQGVFGAQPTSHGMLVAPDVCGAGPMFVAVLRKVQSTASLGYAARFGLQTLSLNEQDDEDDTDDGSASDDGGVAAGGDE